MSLHELSLNDLPHTASRTIAKFNALGLTSYMDLLTHYPFRYEDYSEKISITELKKHVKQYKLPQTEPETSPVDIQKGYTVQGVIHSFSQFKTRRGFSLQKVLVSDQSDILELTFFNQKYLSTLLKKDKLVSISGMIKEIKGIPSFQQTEYEILDDSLDTTKHTGKIIPVYSQIRGLSSKTIRDKIQYILSVYGDSIQETLPQDITQSKKLLERADAFQNIHFPSSKADLLKARERLAFDELFIIQLASHLIKNEWSHEKAAFSLESNHFAEGVQEFIKSQPFSLTQAQQRSIDEIVNDMTKSAPMNRLLQGDVGSGKTVVAAAAAYAAMLDGHTSLFMAPTEILAQQHYQSLQKTFSELDVDIQPKIALKTSKNSSSKEEVSNADIFVGTHALIAKKSTFKNVALVVIDEQHKFGVAQRAELSKKGEYPHILSMTATPIPRTVMLTMYGELDISTLNEMPQGRIPIKTFVVSEKKRHDAYDWIKKQMTSEDAQVFIVCPFIEESNSETMKNVKAAAAEYENLAHNVFADFSVGLLHGKLSSQAKNEVMDKFARHELDILISTPVVEVGIDIPGATIILIETAERFGLAQLHQLRGRVGRSDKQSYCYLFSESEYAMDRLQYFAKTQDGFSLSEYDLQRRGGGNIFGTQQSGGGQLAIASLMDAPLVHDTQDAVQTFIKSYAFEDFEDLRRSVDVYRIQHIAPN